MKRQPARKVKSAARRGPPAILQSFTFLDYASLNALWDILMLRRRRRQPRGLCIAITGPTGCGKRRLAAAISVFFQRSVAWPEKGDASGINAYIEASRNRRWLTIANPCKLGLSIVRSEIYPVSMPSLQEDRRHNFILVIDEPGTAPIWHPAVTRIVLTKLPGTHRREARFAKLADEAGPVITNRT